MIKKLGKRLVAAKGREVDIVCDFFRRTLKSTSLIFNMVESFPTPGC